MLWKETDERGWRRKEPERDRTGEGEGALVTKAEISFGVVPVVILGGFPLWAAQLITGGFKL